MQNTDIKKFDDEGYVVIKNLLDRNNLSKLKEYFEKCFDDYATGVLNNNELRRDHPYYIFSSTYEQNNNKRKNSYFIKEKTLRVDGIPLKHRLFRGQGSPNLEETPNILYGKRFSKNIVNVEDRAYKYIFNENLLNNCKKILNFRELLFLEGSINRIYPKYSGESSMMHIDTYGFTFANNQKRNKNDFFLNVVLFINGTKDGRSPTKIIPKSHKLYNELNTQVAKSINKDDKINCIHQRELYYEIIEDYLDDLIEIEADPGDALIINSNLVHGISENKNNNLQRDAVILNFSKSNQYFGKSRTSEEFLKLNSKLRPYNLKVKREKMIESFKRRVKIKSKIFVKNLLAFNKPKDKVNQQSDNDSKKLNINLDNKIYLNIGSGPNFKDQKTISLDYDDKPEKVGHRANLNIDLNFNLSSYEKLPFVDNRFKGIYTSHCIEHLTDDNADHVIGEVYRVLKKDGVFRIIVPDISKYFNAYDNNDLYFFNWIRNKMPYKYDSWLRFITREFAGNSVDDFSDEDLIKKYKELGTQKYCKFFGKLSNDNSDISRNIPDVHKSYWDSKKMSETLKKIGFKNISKKSQFEGTISHFVSKSNTMFNSTRPYISLFYEGSK